MRRLPLTVACFAAEAPDLTFEPSPKCFAAGVRALTVEHIGDLAVPHAGVPVELRKNESIATKASFKPPVEITIVAKTDSTNLRIGYAADQVIFNWERDLQQLRVDGGPASGKHKAGAGLIPVNQYVTIRWIVRPGEQRIYVDGQLRYQHGGDYSKIDRPVSVFCAKGSSVAVKSIATRDLSQEPAPDLAFRQN